ncbi:MAG: UDP-N-acetylmuramate dehydrogenase, partial [Pseudomonadota bacterium]
RVGGPADVYFKPADVDDLAAFLQQLDEDLPLYWFGLGSNVLVRDGGLRGIVIAGGSFASELEDLGDHRVRVGVSVPCTQLARQCIRWGYGPSEFFAGIPGSVGGALAMNAGAHGGETWERVVSVSTIDRGGEVRVRGPEDFTIAYRQVDRPADEWFIGAELSFESDYEPSMSTLKAMLDRRKTTQPLGLPSCGSVFRNPPGDHAARLIEAAGLKGHRLGGAQVSPKHANFIINADDASAADLEALIELVQETVARAHGVELVHEVRLLGDAS